MIRVIVSGASGRVGQVRLAGLRQQPGLELVGGFGRADAGHLPYLLGQADVLVDFTTAEAAPGILLAAIQSGVRPVSGTTGLSTESLDAVDAAAHERGIGAAWAPNFAIGAVLMIYFAQIAARYMEAGEVIEMHHDRKVDAPSGTSISTARAIRAARGDDLPDPPVQKWTLEGARGAVEGGVRIHSIRLPGLVAHQEVLFGAPGQVLTIRHDAPSREAYVPGVALAVREVMHRVGLVRGLDRLMGLGVEDGS
jgi:4-hydroxy-tetrahydrodipicolinate reductase